MDMTNSSNEIDWLSFVESVKKLLEVVEAPSTFNRDDKRIVQEERIQYFAAKGAIWETISKIEAKETKQKGN